MNVDSRMRWCVLLAAAAMAACGLLGGSEESGPPPDFTIPPQGDAAPPTLDELLADDPVLESGTLSVTGGGDTLTLADGFTLVVPAGAMAAGSTVAVYHHPFTAPGPDAGGGQAVYRFDASAEPSAPVSITFPIPGAPAGTIDAQGVSVIQHHDPDAPRVLTGTVDQAARTVTVQADRFSAFLPTYQGASTPPPADRVVKVPYYSQGSTGNCWSLSLLMLMVAYAEFNQSRPRSGSFVPP